MPTSATSAPCLSARSMTLVPSSMSLLMSYSIMLNRASSTHLRAAHRHGGDLDCWTTYTNWHRLTVLTAGPDTIGALEICAEHADFAHHVWPVADQVHAFERRGELAIFDQIALGE